MRMFLTALVICLMGLTSAAAAHEVAARLMTVRVIETATATHSQESRPPAGCFARLQPDGAGMAAFWTYAQYSFVCHLKPDETIQVYSYNGWDICDTGEDGAYTCGLHGRDAAGNPIDRPPPLALAGMDRRAIPDIVNMLLNDEGYGSRQAAAMLEEYAQSTELPDARASILAYKDQFLAAKAAAQPGPKKAGLTSLLLTLGIELPPADSMDVLGDYGYRLEPRHITALNVIAAHADDPAIDPARLVSLYTQNFVDSQAEQPQREIMVKAVAALGKRLQPSVGLLIERYRSRSNWPAALEREVSGVICSAFTTGETASSATLVIDEYGGPVRISCM